MKINELPKERRRLWDACAFCGIRVDRLATCAVTQPAGFDLSDGDPRIAEIERALAELKKGRK